MLNWIVLNRTDYLHKHLLLSISDVEVYAETEESSSFTCMDNIYKLTIKSRRRIIEITPILFKMNNKVLPVKNRPLIRFRFKKFFHVAVIFNRKGPKQTVSVRFIIEDHLRNAEGLYGKYYNPLEALAA